MGNVPQCSKPSFGDSFRASPNFSPFLLMVTSFWCRLSWESTRRTWPPRAVLHLGTLAAVLAYFRKDLAAMAGFRRDPAARKLLAMIIIGSLPAALALLVVDEVEKLQESITATAIFLILTGVVLAVASRMRQGDRPIDDVRPSDAVLIGFAQLLAVLPGISRSGMTISTGIARGFDQVEAARFSFLLGVPAVAAAGLLELWTLLDDGGVPASAWVGVLVAAITGYGAIAFLLRMLARTGPGSLRDLLRRRRSDRPPRSVGAGTVRPSQRGFGETIAH